MNIPVGIVVVVLLAACLHRKPVAPPDYPVEGAYAFSINMNGVRMQGSFVVADTQVYMYAWGCEPVPSPRATGEMRAAWFACGDETTRRIQLRVNVFDPVNRSRWTARLRVADTVTRCTRYQVTGDCVEVLRARGMKWVDRSGSMLVTRGIPTPDTSRTIDPAGTRRIRARCDTSAASPSCTSDGRRRSHR